MMIILPKYLPEPTPVVAADASQNLNNIGSERLMKRHTSSTSLDTIKNRELPPTGEILEPIQLEVGTGYIISARSMFTSHQRIRRSMLGSRMCALDWRIMKAALRSMVREATTLEAWKHKNRGNSRSRWTHLPHHHQIETRTIFHESKQGQG